MESPDRIQRRLDLDLVDGDHRSGTVNVGWYGHLYSLARDLRTRADLA
jgi:hypothetical protein